MDKKAAKKWIKALRSGQYNQTDGALCKENIDGSCSFCCLGVLANESVDDIGIAFTIDDGEYMSENLQALSIGGNSGTLVPKISKALGMKNGDGDIHLAKLKKVDLKAALDRLDLKIKNVEFLSYTDNIREKMNIDYRTFSEVISLVGLNDSLGCNFEEIAHVIEEFYEII